MSSHVRRKKRTRKVEPPSVVSESSKSQSYDGAVLAIYQGPKSKHYVIMGSPAPIYQALDDTAVDAASNARKCSQSQDQTQTPSERTPLPFDCTNVSFYECRQLKCFRAPDAFDYCCLTAAEYLQLRETHELTDVRDYARACDMEQVAMCVARERAYLRQITRVS